jgi:hypothetical protein
MILGGYNVGNVWWSACMLAPLGHAQQPDKQLPVLVVDIHVSEEVGARITGEEQELGRLHEAHVGEEFADGRPRRRGLQQRDDGFQRRDLLLFDRPGWHGELQGGAALALIVVVLVPMKEAT